MCDDCSSLNFGQEDGAFSQEITFQDKLYNSLEQLIRSINHAINHELMFAQHPEDELLHAAQRRRQNNDSTLPNFEYNEKKNTVCITLPKSMGIEMSPSLANIFGFGTNQLHLENHENQVVKVFAEKEYDVNAGINSLYVYCDVLEHVPVGDTKAPLLRIVNARGSSHEVVHLTYNKPRYVPLQKNNFDSIEIDIRDCFEDPIPFENGQAVVVLEFNRRKNPYLL